jgi:hypothetical protein
MPRSCTNVIKEAATRMPAKPRWFTRLPEIIAELKQLDTPVIERHICEILFTVRRRRALSSCGASVAIAQETRSSWIAPI